MHFLQSNLNVVFILFLRDLNHGLLEDDMSVPTNGRSFASFRQNVDPDMCMALLNIQRNGVGICSHAIPK